MKIKYIGVIGLFLLIISRILLMQGNEFLTAQQPVDFAHWLMLIGAAMTISFSFVFPKSIINTVATSMTIIGIVAHIGMSAIDFVFWSFGDDFASRDELLGHLINTPAIWLPFFTVGPAFLFAGISTQAWQFIRSHTIFSILAIGGSLAIGFGQMVSNNQILILIGYIVFSLGMTLLVFRKNKVAT